MPTPSAGSPRFGPLYFLATLGDMNVSTLAFVTSYLGTKVGGTPFEIGLIGMAYGLMYCVAPALMGKLGYRVGRRPTILVALVAFLSTNVYMLALMGFHSPWTIMLGTSLGESVGDVFGQITSRIYPNGAQLTPMPV